MLLLLIILLVLIAASVPIAYSLGVATLVFFLADDPQLIQVLPQRFFAGMNSYALITLPLFILMGMVMNAGLITSRLIEFSLIFVGRLRGGLGLVNVFASMLFGGISGSSASDTASIGSVLIPEMEKRGYPRAFASGITVASSTMGMIIPPSIPMVLYAVVSQESVGRLFLHHHSAAPSGGASQRADRLQPGDFLLLCPPGEHAQRRIADRSGVTFSGLG